MNPSIRGKFLVVISVASIIIFAIVKSFGAKDELPEETFENEDGYTYTDTFEGSINVDKDIQLGDNNEVPTGDTEVNYEEFYVLTFGKEKVEMAKQQAKNTMTYWLEGETDMDKWRSMSSESFLLLVQNEVLAPKDQLTREVTDLNITFTEVEEENDIQFMMYATWDLLSGNSVVKEQSNMYVLTLTLIQDDRWVVKELARV